MLQLAASMRGPPAGNVQRPPFVAGQRPPGPPRNLKKEIQEANQISAKLEQDLSKEKEIAQKLQQSLKNEIDSLKVEISEKSANLEMEKPKVLIS